MIFTVVVYFLKVDLNFFHKNCACFDDFIGDDSAATVLQLRYLKMVDREIDFGKWKNW